RGRFRYGSRGQLRGWSVSMVGSPRAHAPTREVGAMNHSAGRLRATVYAITSTNSVITTRCGGHRSVGLPRTRWTVQTTNPAATRGAAITMTAWLRGAGRRAPSSSAGTARLEPQPGQYRPVRW